MSAATAPVRASDVARIDAALAAFTRLAALPRLAERIAARAGVTLDRALYVALSRIADEGPLRLSDLAQSLGVDVSTASRQVAGLERRGMVERRAHEGDRRCSQLALSAPGRRTLQKLREARRAAVADLLAEWSSKDLRHLASLLERLTGDLRRHAGEPVQR